jgi:DNA-binding MarR family transcriptional regulator
MERFESFVGGVTLLYRCIQKIKNMETAEMGLRGRHVMCIYNLGRNPEGLTSAQLAMLCGEDKAAVSRTLAELVERGLVEKPEGYRAPVTLTDAGREVAGRVETLAERAVEHGGAGLSDAERETFYRAMGVIGKNLMRMCGEDTER